MHVLIYFFCFRNFGEDVQINCHMQTVSSESDSKNFYRCTMTVNEHSATVICQNKREGRQKGAQALLKVLNNNRFAQLNYTGHNLFVSNQI